MKFFIVAVCSSVLFSCGQSSEQNFLHSKGDPLPPAVVELVLPESLTEALVVNYDLGRLNWDSYGVSKIRHFQVKAKSLSVIDVVAEMIKRSSLDQEGSLADFCGFSRVEDMVGRSLEECASYIVYPGSRSRIQGFLTNVSSREGQNEDHIRFNSAIRTINDYVLRVMGEEYSEYSAPMHVWNVDIVTSILIDRDEKNILVVTWDYGA